ncbi:hypothetical protein LDENG_00171540 [Lucifuga dentata]|nr:hypothetical protein LDENG_00171540 [Lucifuga dentata]
MQSDGSCRSPAVFGATVSYVRDVLDLFGIDMLYGKDADKASCSTNLEGVVEQLTHFRSKVRAFALRRQDDPTTGTLKKTRLHPDRIPLLKACDTLRNDLAPLGVVIKDRGATSTWEIIHGRATTQKGQEVLDKDQEMSL